MQNVCKIFVESMQGLCRIFVGSMLVVCRIYVGSMQDLCWIYAECMQNLCKIYVESLLNHEKPICNYGERIYDLHKFHPGGLVQGTLGTIVKPVAAIGTAFSEAKLCHHLGLVQQSLYPIVMRNMWKTQEKNKENRNENSAALPVPPTVHVCRCLPR